VFFCVTFGICDPPVVETLRGRRSLSPLSLDLHVDGADAALAPTEGYRVRIDFEHGLPLHPLRLPVQPGIGPGQLLSALRGPPRHVVSANLRVGWVGALEGTRQALGIREIGRELIHPRKRFFAGGARSVRGYPENQLGPAVLTIPREDLLAEDRCTQEEIADRSCDPALAPADAFFPGRWAGPPCWREASSIAFPWGR
jgi:hypothetical protein